MEDPLQSVPQLTIPLNPEPAPVPQEHAHPAEDPNVNYGSQELYRQTVPLPSWPAEPISVNEPLGRFSVNEPLTPLNAQPIDIPIQMNMGNMGYMRRARTLHYSVGDCLFDLFIRLPWLIYSSTIHFLTFPVVGILDMPPLQMRPQLQQTIIELVLKMLQMWTALAICNVYMAFQSIYESDQIADISEYLSSSTLRLTILMYIIGILLHTCNWALIDFWFGLQTYICAFFMRLSVEDFSFASKLSALEFLPLVVGISLILVEFSIFTTKTCQWGHIYFQKRKFEMECDVFGLTAGHCLAQICITYICGQYIPLRARGVNLAIRELTQKYNSAIRSNYYLFLVLGVFFTLTFVHWIDRCIPALNTNIFHMPRTADSFRAGTAKFLDIMIGFFLGSLFVPPHSSFHGAEVFAFANGITFAILIVFLVIGLYESATGGSSQTKCNHIRRIYTRTGGFMLAASWDQAVQAVLETQSNSKFLILIYKFIYAFFLTFAWVIIGLAVTQLKSQVMKKYIKEQQYTRALHNLG